MPPRSQGGLGIRLTLVKPGRNARRQRRGSQRRLGRGSEFAVRLPLLPPQVSTSSAKASVAGPRTQARRILVVDDNKDAAVSLALLLRLHGHQVQVAHDGPAALGLAREFRPHVVFLDIGMPGMDGYEVARRFREGAEFEGSSWRR